MARDSKIPNTIPLVGFDENDEPFIVKAAVVQKSPLPPWVAAIVIMLACFTVAQGYYFSVQRNKDFECGQARDRAILLQIQDRLDTADTDRGALKEMVQSVLTTTDPAKGRKILQDFIAKSDATDLKVVQQRAILDQLLKEKCG